MERSTHTQSLTVSRRRSRWEAFASMPLTGLVLLIALALAILPLAGASNAQSAAPTPATAPHEEIVPTAPLEKQPSEEPAPHSSDPDLISILVGSHVLQPIEVVLLTVPHDPT